MRELLAQVIGGAHLSREQAREAFGRVMAGEVDAPALGAFLCALTTKGEQVEELVGAAQAMRAAATKVRCARPCLCTCGTGGDGISTFNVSTTAAIIAAAAGAVVAKHGNRTNTRASGSSEVLAELGININADAPALERCLATLNLAFLHAPNLHPAMRNAAAVRKALRARTIFNLLGPLCNPAGATHQVLGVSKAEHVELLAEALRRLGAERAWVVHGSDGLCDLTITGPTLVAELSGGNVRRRTVHPGDVGFSPAPLAELLVSSAAQSAAAVKAILEGERGPKRDHALLNAGAALVVYGAARDLEAGVELATRAIDTGDARRKLAALIELSHS